MADLCFGHLQQLQQACLTDGWTSKLKLEESGQKAFLGRLGQSKVHPGYGDCMSPPPPTGVRTNVNRSGTVAQGVVYMLQDQQGLHTLALTRGQICLWQSHAASFPPLQTQLVLHGAACEDLLKWSVSSYKCSL